MIHRIGVPFLLSVLIFAPAASSDESTILKEVSTDELEAHAREIIQHVRPGGSPGEFAAIDYIVKTLEADGVPVEVLKFSAYVSDPVQCKARLKTIDAGPITCLTQALAQPTVEGGLSGPLVDCGKGTAADYRRVDVKGKIALVEALAYPSRVDAAEKAGATAVVFSSPNDQRHRSESFLRIRLPTRCYSGIGVTVMADEPVQSLGKIWKLKSWTDASPLLRA